MKFVGKLVCLALLLVSCGERFETVTLLPHTPVKDQGEWPAGWIYATLSLVESERILAGDSLELSATYLMRQQAEYIFNPLMHDVGTQKPTEFTGSPWTCLRLMETKGILPYNVFRPKLAMAWSDCIVWANRGDLQTVLDTGFAYMPRQTSLYGTLYSPLDLTRSLYTEGYYEGFVFKPASTLDAEPYDAEQFFWDDRPERYTNQPERRILPIIDETLAKGHTLVWMGDTANAGYRSNNGVAEWRKQGNAFLPSRSDLYTHVSLHCLHIVGKAKGWEGLRRKTYYICKDSHGEAGPYKGFIYLSEDFLRRQTVLLFRHKL
jgi:bleomycin hydrolase